MEGDEKAGKGKKSNKLLAALPKLKLKKKALKSTLEALSPVLRQLIGHISVHGIHVEGVFRLSGSLTTMQQLQKSVLKGEEIEVKDIEDIHVATGLLKSLLREMSEPLIPFSAYSPMLDRSESMNAPDIRVKVYRTILANINPLNQELLDEVIRLALLVAANEKDTRMSARNLAVVLGPVLMRRSPKEETLETLMADSAKVVDTVKEVIERWSEITPRTDVTKPVPLIEMSPISPRGSSEERTPRKSEESAVDYKAKWQAAMKRCEELERDYTVTFLHATNLQTKLQEKEDSLQYVQDQLRQMEDHQQTSAREEQEEASKLAANLRSESRKWQDTVAALELDIESMKRSQSDLMRELETEKSLHKLTKDRLASAEKERTAAESTSDQRARQLETQIKELQAAAKANGEALKARESTIAQLKQQLATAEESRNTSATETAKLKKDLESALSEKKSVESALASLKTDKNSMERDWLQLKAKVATMETQLNERQADANERLEQHRASVAENAELRFHLFNWILLSIKLDLLARGVSAQNIEKNELFQRLEEEKVPLSKWPQRILQQLER
eukprot:TRINITY_DN6625_c0_g4_i3.p1 TRINITY_DN6625_c0_g4~~TRINITY_DN6625_c0_g4_i3.p1  ORF type:complete len:580 (+),score=130.66 TRINITY_DN6625_c0_g4_i3:45-1742(+)